MSIKKPEDLGLKELYTFMLRSTQLSISVSIQLDIIKDILAQHGLLDQDEFTKLISERGGELIKGVDLMAKEMEGELDQSNSPS